MSSCAAHKNKLKININEKIGIKYWQCNIIEELMNVKESCLEAILERREINTMLENVSIL